jgi:hypothetical protein
VSASIERLQRLAEEAAVVGRAEDAAVVDAADLDT